MSVMERLARSEKVQEQGKKYIKGYKRVEKTIAYTKSPAMIIVTDWWSSVPNTKMLKVYNKLGGFKL